MRIYTYIYMCFFFLYELSGSDSIGMRKYIAIHASVSWNSVY